VELWRAEALEGHHGAQRRVRREVALRGPAQPIRAGAGLPVSTTRARAWPRGADDGRRPSSCSASSCGHRLVSRAIVHARLGGRRAASGGRAPPAREGTHAAAREPAHALAHAAQAVGTPDALFCQDHTHARFGDRPLYPSV